MNGRYDVDPTRLQGKKSIIEFMQEVLKKVGSDDASLQIGHTSIEDGDLIIRNGDIIVSETDGEVVLQIMHGITPEIRFFPLGVNDTHRVALFAYDFGGGAAAPDQAVQLCVETVGSVQDGGKLLLSRNYAILSHQPNGGSESYLWLNGNLTGSQEALFRGKWSNQAQFDSNMGLYMGVINAGGGFSSWTHTYFTSFATTIAPVVGLVNNPVVTWTILGFSTSSFTVGWTGTASKTITFWNFRVA